MHSFSPARPLRVAIVAGEVSGDILAAGLMREIRQRHPDVEFIGIAGPQMQQEGIISFRKNRFTLLNWEESEKAWVNLDD